MELININEVVKVVNGELQNNSLNIFISGISIDSRKVKKGDLFIAIKGENFDGHDFIDKAILNGCSAIIASKNIHCNIPFILVENTQSALINIAKYYRSLYNIPIISVTGSTGKTSTKEMIWSVLSQKYNVHKTSKNFNNEIGLPLTLLEICKEHDMAVIEMGMSNLGEIENLADAARPNIAVITNIGTAHLENLKSRENIFKAKMEITKFLKKDDILFINSDDDFLSKVKCSDYIIKKISLKGNGDYNAEKIIDNGEKGVEFDTNYMNNSYHFKIDSPGKHNIYNALYAIAIAENFKIPVQYVYDGILKFKPCDLRMDIIMLDNDIKIIDDSYNANVDSMKAAIDVLNSYKNRKKICILGDMLELGTYSEYAHREIGKYIIDKADVVFTIGNYANFIKEETKLHMKTYYFKCKEEAFHSILDEIKQNSVVLIKGSRGMKMELITKYIIDNNKR